MECVNLFWYRVYVVDNLFWIRFSIMFVFVFSCCPLLHKKFIWSNINTIMFTYFNDYYRNPNKHIIMNINIEGIYSFQMSQIVFVNLNQIPFDKRYLSGFFSNIFYVDLDDINFMNLLCYL